MADNHYCISICSRERINTDYYDNMWEVIDYLKNTVFSLNNHIHIYHRVISFIDCTDMFIQYIRREN